MEDLAQILNNDYDKMLKDNKSIVFRRRRNRIKLWTIPFLALGWIMVSDLFPRNLGEFFLLLFFLVLILFIYSFFATLFQMYKVSQEIKNEIEIYKTNLLYLDDLKYNSFYIDYDSKILTLRYISGTLIYQGEIKEFGIQKEERTITTGARKEIMSDNYKSTQHTVTDIKYIIELKDDKFLTIEDPADELIKLFRSLDNSRV